MDLWAWVNDTERRLRKEGHTRLADLIDRLPTEVCNDRHDRVDAIVPEALALAKSHELPWLEVFLRHWWLQSRVLHRMDGNALGDAVRLVELAHRDETRACPQGICSVQDLASCYGFVDGPGYCEERLEVARETLGRIDASWPCFTCISSEYASALRDRGDSAESLAFIDRQIGTLTERGQRKAIYDFPRDRIEVLIDLGRYDDALAFVEDLAKNGRRDAHHALSRRVDRARILARLGRGEEALASLPPVDEVRPTPIFYALWADAAEQLVKSGLAPNDGALGRVLQGFVDRLEKQGVGRKTLELADLHGHLALARGAPHVARRALAAMERASKLLHKPLDALDRIGKLRTAIDAAPGPAALELLDPETTLAEVQRGEGKDPERDLLLLEAASTRFPADVPLALALAGCELANGLEAEAIASLDAFHTRTNNIDVALRLGDLLTSRRDERLQTVVERHRAAADTDASRAIADWLLARDAHARGDWAACRDHLDVVLRGRPDAINSRLLWADAARRLGDLPGALSKLDEVVERVAEPGPHDWDRMVVATLLSDWPRVRDSAKRLGFELEGEGPIEERWGMCRIRFDDEGRDAWAVRTGPVTARILEVARPPAPQRFDDVVVFEASPLNPPPAPEEREGHTFIYPHLATLREAGFRAYEIDGVHPGDEVLDAMRAAASELGCELQVLSGEQYKIKHGDDELQGLFAVVAIPRERAAAEVCAALRGAVGERAITFMELARDGGDVALAEAQVRLVEEYGL